MHGSNNEVAVLEAVLGSLSKSPAFDLFDEVVAILPTSDPEPIPVIEIDYLSLIQRVADFEGQIRDFPEGKTAPMTLTSSQRNDLKHFFNL
jgi:hypothetical protein